MIRFILTFIKDMFHFSNPSRCKFYARQLDSISPLLSDLDRALVELQVKKEISFEAACALSNHSYYIRQKIQADYT